MSNYKVSIIIVYNNEQKLEEAKKYIFQQTLKEVELVALDNRHQRFSSAAKALNFGASVAQSDILIFMHQDVYLWDLDFIKKYYLYLSQRENVIAGVVGVREKDGATVGDFYEGRISKLRPLELTNGEITEVYSVDEFLFGMQKKLWERLKFDETNCFDWHFYAVDICYANKLGGGTNVLLSSGICHDSKGNGGTREFRKTAFNLIKKYRGKVKRIDGTCFHCKCSYRGYLLWRLWQVRRRLIGR